ncbi:MAG: AAA family ATPase [Desulfobacteraceae bacterium]|nr:AAA family ATPase [Desulfobacteraceae bacterium]
MNRNLKQPEEGRPTLLDWARGYLTRGFSIIPVTRGTKKPALSSWREFQERRVTDKEVNAWFGNGSNGIGIVTGVISGIAVVDLDGPEAVAFAKAHDFPPTPLVKTGKGYHAYYRYSAGVRNFQKRDDLPGIDLRGDGGFVVAPPSVHASGNRYQWVEGKGLDDLPLAELPAMILAQRPEDKTSLVNLYKGVARGSRNDALARLAGSWAKDGLPFDQCLEMAYIWNTLNTSPLPGKEIERTIKSIIDRHRANYAQKDPAKTGMVLTTLGDLLKEPEENVTWLVDGLLPTGGFSVMAAKPKVGKSTLARDLSFSIARGKSFLGRDVAQGPVIYLALEEKKSEVRRHFKDMGASGEEPIFIYSGRVPSDAIDQITAAVQKIKPVLVVIDPLFRFTRVKDTSAYAEITAALEPFLHLSRETGAHILCIHHSSKGNRQGGDSLLGSTAIFGSVDTLILLNRNDSYRTIQSIQRYGSDLPETVLSFDNTQRTVTIGKSKHETDLDQLKEALLDYLATSGEPLTEAVIGEEVEGRTALKRKALRELVADGVVARTGKGGKADPFKYSCSHVPVYIEGTTKQEPEKARKPNTVANYSCSRNSGDNEKTREQESAAPGVIDLEHGEVEILE